MKRFFTLLAVAFSLLTANAQSAGEYVYTDNGKFKILSGENLIVNGDFSKGRDGWTTDGGQPLNVDTFDVATEGPDGSMCLVVNMKDNGPGTGSSFMQKVFVSAGTDYVISYQVQGNDEAVTTTVSSSATSKNYQNIFFNEDGSLTAIEGGNIAKSQTYGFDWQTIRYGFKAPMSGYIVIHFYAPYINTRFDNFVIMEAQQVVDDRESDKIIANLQTYINNPLFPNGHDILEGAIAVLQETVSDDDLLSYNEILGILDETIADFLDQNTANVTSYLKNGNFDDLKATSANQRSAGAWTIDDITPATGKTRWAVKDASATGAPFTGMYLMDDVPGPYYLRQATVHQTIENMPAAKYMFTIKARAGFQNKNNVFQNFTVRGLKVFINSDSVECHPISYPNPDVFSVISEMKETGSMKLGFHVTDSVCNHLDFDVVDLRIIGWTAEQLDEYMGGKEYAEAKAALKHSIDSARVLYNNAELLYGKPQLDSAIVASQNYYDNISITDSLTDSRTRLNKEISNYISRNGSLTTFRQAITSAEAMIADSQYAEADKNALQTAIDAAKTFLSSLNAENHLTEGFTNDDIKEQTATLNKAINLLLASTIKADEKYEFYNWAATAVEGMQFDSMISEMTEENAIVTSGNATLYPEMSTFADHSLNGRFAFLQDGNLRISMNASHGMEVTFTGKNKTTMAILNLKEGDQIDIDWAMGNASHGVMVVSANAKVKLADGTWQQYTKTGKDNANVLPKDNTDGLSGSVHSTLVMTQDGTLDFYQYSSNSTIRIYYLGITNAENVVDGIATLNPSPVISHNYYDLQGRIMTSKPAKGIYIQNGKKFVIK